MLCHLLLASTLFLTTASLICSEGSSPVFITEKSAKHFNLLTRSPCFRQCALSNCTGVLLSKNSCAAINTHEYYGLLDTRRFVKKECVVGPGGPRLIRRVRGHVLIAQTEKVVPAEGELDCISICFQQTNFTCLSTMWYAEEKDCFLNYADSHDGDLSADTNGFSVDFFELGPLDGDPCEKRRNAFTLIPSLQINIRADVATEISTSIEECLSTCNGCDFAVYTEGTSTCTRLFENLSGTQSVISENGTMVFERLCRSGVVRCPPRESIFITRHSMETRLRSECLSACMNDQNCAFGYAGNTGCRISEISIRSLPRILERKCVASGLQPDLGFIFEETPTCVTGGAVSLDIGRTKCFNKCLRSDDRRCEAVSYDRLTRKCELFEIGMKKFASNEKLQKIKPLEPLKHIKTEAPPEVIIIPHCRFGNILIELSSPVPFNGVIFPRNFHDGCREQIVNGKATLTLELGSNSSCRAEYDEVLKLYKTVLIVKSSPGESSVLTDDDRLFHLSCKYGKNHSTIAKSRPLGIELPAAKDLAVQGTVQSPRQMVMRQIGRSTPEIVELGDPVQLNFMDAALTGGFSLDSCYATDRKNLRNISLIQKGCSMPGQDHVVTHRIRYRDDGFTFAIKAFKFSDGESVRITCLVKKCTGCPHPSCHQVAKRSPELEMPHPSAEVTRIVAEFIVEKGHQNLCAETSLLYSVAAIFISFFSVELLALTILCRRQKRITVNK